MSGTTTTTSSTAAQPAFQAAYQNLLTQAQGVASQPLQQYSGQMVAGLSPDQQTAISTVNNSQGIAAPYINNAAQHFDAATQPIWSGVQQFSPSAVQQYESPYTQGVVNATQNQFNQQNAQQQSQLTGNAVSQGAYGGDRQAIAATELAGQQDKAQAPVIAGLNNQGYAQALQEFNSQQGAQVGANEANSWLNSQAAFGMGSLGQEAQTTALSGASAQLQTGQLEQTQNQSQLNVPYQQYLQQQAYPYQTTSWLSGIETGAGSASGSSGTSTGSSTASTASTIAGLGTAAVGAAGLLNSSGATSSGGWLSNLFGTGGDAKDTVTSLGGDTWTGAGAMADTGWSDVLPALVKRGGGIAGPDDHGVASRASGGGISVSMTDSAHGGPEVPMLDVSPTGGISSSPGTESSALSNYLAMPSGISAPTTPTASFHPNFMPQAAAATPAAAASTGATPTSALDDSGVSMTVSGGGNAGSNAGNGYGPNQGQRDMPAGLINAIGNTALGIGITALGGPVAGMAYTGAKMLGFNPMKELTSLFSSSPTNSYSDLGYKDQQAKDDQDSKDDADRQAHDVDAQANGNTDPDHADAGTSSDQNGEQASAARGGALHIARRDDGGSINDAEDDFARETDTGDADPETGMILPPAPPPGGAPPDSSGIAAPSSGKPAPISDAAPGKVSTGDSIRKNAPYMALMTAGFGMLAGHSNGIANIGAGALEGVKAFEGEEQRATTADQRDSQAQYRQDTVQNRSKQLQQAVQNEKDKAAHQDKQDGERDTHDRALEVIAMNHVGIAGATQAETASYHNSLLEQGRWTYGGTDKDTGKPIFINGKDGTMKLGDMAMAPKASDQVKLDQNGQRIAQGDTRLDQNGRKLDQGDARLDQGDQRIAQGDTRITATAEYRDQMRNLREGGMSDANARARAALDVGGAKSIVAAAANMGKTVSYADALKTSIANNDTIPSNPTQRPAPTPAPSRGIAAPTVAPRPTGALTGVAATPAPAAPAMMAVPPGAPPGTIYSPKYNGFFVKGADGKPMQWTPD